MKRLVLVCMVVVLVGTGVPGLGLGADRIKIAMGYIPNVQFAPYYLAKEKGYFHEQGLEVKFDYGMATDIMSLVAQGEVDFGVSDGDQVIIAREKGVPVKVVYSMYVKYPVGIVSFKQKGIQTAEDLKGKRIGCPGPYGSSFIGLQIILQSGGLTLKDVDVKYIGYNQIESLVSDRVDAAVVFINNEPIVLRERGKEVNVIETHPITPMVSAAVITGERMIREQPGLVSRFVKAIQKASRDALENKNQVIYQIKEYIPTLGQENLPVNQKVLMASMELWVDRDIKQYTLGYTTREDWQKSIQTMYRLGFIESKPAPEECFTNEFIK
ncbi:MAG: ABC transporter substrate-binding protein [Spirochaetota bacterium]